MVSKLLDQQETALAQTSLPSPMLDDINQYSKEELYSYLEQIIQGSKANSQPHHRTAENSPDVVNELLNAAEILQKDVLDIVKKFRHLNTNLEQEVAQRTEQLAISEANLKALLENTSDLILSVDRDFRVLVINSALQNQAREVYGIELKPEMDLLKVCPPQVVDFWLPDFKRAMAGETFKVVRTFGAEGEQEHYEFSYNPILNREYEVTGVSFFGKDITEKQTALEESQAKEQFLASINHSIKEGIFRTHVGKIIYVNKAFVEMFGYDSVEEMLKLDPYALYVDESRRDYFRDLMQENTYFVNEEVQFKRKDGSTFWGLMSSIKAVREDGEVYYDGAIRDVTDIKEARRNLELRNQELTKVNRELDSFVYSTSHDLRAPLVSLQGLIQVARLSDTHAERESYFGLMETTIEKLDSFIQDIIYYSRNARVEVRPEAINFQTLLQSSEEDLRYMEGAEQTQLTLHVEGEVSLWSDPMRLRMIFSNLLSNSIRYRDPGKMHNQVEVRVRQKDEGTYVAFEDNGQGIAPEHQPHVFEMFYRGHERSQGSGIGLYIVQEAVHKLKGRISLTSTLSEGTCFSLFLPHLVAVEK